MRSLATITAMSPTFARTRDALHRIAAEGAQVRVDGTDVVTRAANGTETREPLGTLRAEARAPSERRDAL
jgi:hypothetical protein